MVLACLEINRENYRQSIPFDDFFFLHFTTEITKEFKRKLLQMIRKNVSRLRSNSGDKMRRFFLQERNRNNSDSAVMFSLNEKSKKMYYFFPIFSFSLSITSSHPIDRNLKKEVLVRFRVFKIQHYYYY